MKKGLGILLAVLIAVSISSVSFAMKEHKADAIKGEVTHVDKDMVTVKDEHGKEHQLHIDAHSTKVTPKGHKLAVGDHVDADAEPSGHATSVTVHPAKAKAAH